MAGPIGIICLILLLIYGVIYILTLFQNLKNLGSLINKINRVLQFQYMVGDEEYDEFDQEKQIQILREAYEKEKITKDIPSNDPATSRTSDPVGVNITQDKSVIGNEITVDQG